MRFFHKGKDGGPESPVTGYWLVEIKGLFSVLLLRFGDGARTSYHSHAFNAFTWFLRGDMIEERLRGKDRLVEWSMYRRSLLPKLTRRDNLHRVHSRGTSWAFTLRGPWADHWWELRGGRKGRAVVLTHGRREMAL